MKILYDINDTSNHPKAVTIGNFDGVHKGHKVLLEKTKDAANNNIESLILTFNQFPREIFKPHDFQRLYSNENKYNLLKEYELDILLSIDFNSIKNYSAQRFCEDILIKKLNTKYLIIGENFKFGKDRLGNVESLRAYNKDDGFEVITPHLEIYQNKSISSSRIREYLSQGNLKAASKCLGRDYMISGTVISGEKLGRELGYPTANITLEHDYPLDGIYLSKVFIDDEKYFGLASVGNKPTFKGKDKLLEVFILDFDNNIYGKKIYIHFLEEIRKQVKFDSKDSLIKQMNEDYKYAIINSKKYGI